MINLIRNELFKIFHKKGIYIMFVLTLALSAMATILLNIDIHIPMGDVQINSMKESIKEYESGTVEYDDYYVDLKASLDIYELQKENKVYDEYYSNEYYYIFNYIRPLYIQYYSTKYIDKDEDSSKLIKDQIDESVTFLHNYDWKKMIEKEINEINDQQKICEELGQTDCSNKYDQERLYVLNYRLENEIPYSYKDGSTSLDDYLTSFNTYESLEKDESKITKHSDLKQLKQLESNVKKDKYKLEHKLITNKDSLSNFKSTFIGSMGNVSLFIVIFIVLVSSAIVADEFNKGTIKQLLVRPFTRSKILASKIIAVLITVLLFVLLISIGEAVVNGIITKTFYTITQPQLYYNFNAHEVVEVNILLSGLLEYVCVIPEIIILVLITFFASVLLTNNGISTAVGVLIFAASGILELYVDSKKFVSYIPFVNWNFSSYLFGGISSSKYLTLTKSLTVTVITVIVFTIATFVIFKHKDIKNQ